ncbi:MAG: ExbD/TolR family protein [Nitrospiria bacterium]
MRRSLKRRNVEGVSLNITPFMNLMVVLIPFLLSGIVFSRLAILEMKLPTGQSATSAIKAEKDPFRLIVTLREKELTILGSGIKKTQLPFKKGNYDLAGLTSILKQMKQQHPQETSMILLSEPEIPYESLIAIMDACREDQAAVLFPDISIGEVKAI